MSTYDDGSELEFFEEPETLEAPGRERRRMRPRRPSGPRRPAPPPPGAVALARLAGLVALAIAVVVGLVFWVGSCQGKSKHDEYASYMNSVRAIAQTSAASGGTAAFAKEVNSTKKLNLAELQTKLEQWSRQQQLSYDDALRLRPPGPLQSVQQQVLATLQLRAIGLTSLANALGKAGSKSSLVVGQLLAKQARLLKASDLVWVELFKFPATEILKSAGVRGVIAPASLMVQNPEVFGAGAFQTVYEAVSATTPTGKVTGKHGSALLGTEAVSTGQAKPLSPSSPTTVDVAADLAFRVTFQNSGNYRETGIPVTLTVNVFNNQVLTKTKTVSVIEPNEKKTVSFVNLKLPNSAFSTQAIVRVVVGKVPGEKIVSNNRASYPVFFSLPSGG